ncbi:unnamed protein product [Amaranthus hypochondriacus]
MNPYFLNKTFLRLLSCCIFFFLLRFIFIISFNESFCNHSSSNFCFFSTSKSHQHADSSHGNLLQNNFQTFNEYEFYSSIFQDLIFNGFLYPNSSSFLVSKPHIIALQDLGINQTFSTFEISDHSFDFMFFHDFDFPSITLMGIVFQIKRTLNPSGFLVIHTKNKDFYAFQSILELFTFCNLIRVRDIHGSTPSIPSIREIILQKSVNLLHKHDQKLDQCSIPEYKFQLINDLEPLIEKEPLKPWITLKRNMKNVKYLTSMVDISFKPRYVYIDVGSRNYGSSIGSWFKRVYPKQNKSFEIYAIEADKEFHGEYKSKKDVTLLPFAAWLMNETLFFEINREPRKKKGKNRGMGRIDPVQSSERFVRNVGKIMGFDLAEWLKNEFEEMDFVVMKMDIEGTEFNLIPKLIETGAICLIDEMFLECHYNRWQRCCPGVRSPKYEKSYVECFQLFSSLRNRGVLVHQWW